MEKEKKNLLVFGYGLAAILCFFAVRHGMKHGYGAVSYVEFFLAAGILFITFFSLPTLKKFYTIWMSVAQRIGHVVTTALLVLLFYCVFGLVGIVLRILRKDLLDQNVNLDKKSYWIPKGKTAFNKESYQKQF